MHVGVRESWKDGLPGADVDAPVRAAGAPAHVGYPPVLHAYLAVGDPAVDVDAPPDHQVEGHSASLLTTSPRGDVSEKISPSNLDSLARGSLQAPYGRPAFMDRKPRYSWTSHPCSTGT